LTLKDWWDYHGRNDDSHLFKKGGNKNAYIARMISDLIDGLQYIHQQGYYHLDIHEKNIMLFGQIETPTMKFIDFGEAVKIQGKQSMHDEEDLYPVFRNLCDACQKSKYCEDFVGKLKNMESLENIKKDTWLDQTKRGVLLIRESQPAQKNGMVVNGCPREHKVRKAYDL